VDNNRFLMAKSVFSLAIMFSTSLLIACNEKSDISHAETKAAQSAAAPNVGKDDLTKETMSYGDSAKNIDALKKKLEGASSEDMESKSEELWAAKDFVSAVAIAEMAYRADGNKNAAYRLGTAYYGGWGVEKNLSKAAEYLNIKSLDDVSYAIYYRGLIQADKDYSGFDTSKARANLEKAKLLGVTQAQDAIKALPSN
jgi:TPR repeat protein